MTPRSRSTDGALRYIDIGRYQDTFLIFAVATIIVIRLELWYTNYPQVGGGGLHIAHLLYGGALMVVVIALLLSFLGRRWRMPAAVLGGIGFGLFIDELGKFITEDNNYFFKPTAAIIYIVFIVLFFATRIVRNRRGFSEREYLSNAIDLLGEAATGRGLSERDQRRALELLDAAGDEPLAGALRDLATRIEAIPTPPPSRLVGWALGVRDHCYEWTEQRWFRWAVVAVFGVWAIAQVTVVVLFLLVSDLQLGVVEPGFATDRLSELRFVNVATIVSVAVTLGFNVAGLLALRRDRVTAYRMFEWALLVTIFVTQVFVFAESSFSGTTGFVISVVLLFTVRSMLRREADRGAVEPRPTTLSASV